MVRLVVFGTLFLTICIVLVIFVARQQPLPPRLAMLHLTDCELPCWVGITPGVTPADQVKARIKAVYGDSKTYRIEDDSMNPSAVTIRRTGSLQDSWFLNVNWWELDDPRIAGGIAISAPIEVGDVLNLFGRPSYVITLPTGDQTESFFAFTYAHVVVLDSNVLYPPKQLISGRVSLHDRIQLAFWPVVFPLKDFGEVAAQDWRGSSAIYTFNFP